MFENSLVESTPLLSSQNRWPAMAAFAIQAALVLALVAVPLWHPEILPLGVPKLTLVAPSPVIKTPPPPPPRVIPMQASGVAEAAPSQQARIPQAAFASDAQGLDRPALPVGINFAGADQSPLSALNLAMPAAPHVVARPAAAGVAARLHVSTGVMQGRLLEPIRPQYPAIARLSHSEGTVVVKAIISTSGTIESAQVVSGPAILQAAALDAVRQARYRPFLLNGQPTAVETTISIVFRIGS